MESPSYVLVPRPISSRITRLLSVAVLSIYASSLISTKNVLCPCVRLSEAPILVYTLSTVPISALSAGTKHPVCAISTIRAVWRIYVDFPAILGPVIRSMLWSVLFTYVSFDTNVPPSDVCSITGCLPPFISILSPSFTQGFT